MKTEEFIKSNACVIEPIDKVFYSIKNNQNKRIIISGGRGVGKSLVLCNCDLKTKESDEPIILTRFDTIGIFSKGLEHIFTNEFYEHYYEIIMSFKLLNYIKEQYNIRNVDMIEIEKLYLFEETLNAYDVKLVNYINNVCFDEDMRLLELIKTGQLTDELLYIMRNVLKFKTISLAIDKFDWTNSNNILSQEVLSKYFKMFDKVIVTTDDEKLLQPSNRDNLHNKGYDFIDISYGKDINVIKEIIKKKIITYNQDIRDLEFKYNNISRDIYDKLIDKTNGNISVMLYTAKYAYDTYQWEGGEWNVDKCFDFALDVKVEEHKKLTKMMKSPKLYL